MAGAGARAVGAVDAAHEAQGPPTTEAAAWTKVRCRGKHGAWAALLLVGDEQEVLAGSSRETSANRLELEAGIAVLHECPQEVALTIHAGDYLRKGASEWLPGWKTRGWKTGSGSAVKNRDLWVQVDRLLMGREIEWRVLAGGFEGMVELERRVKEELGET
ncbi:MAG TPA: RNase H family protein [Thermoanaerobaculia bacterium]|nr:RNase H family protein [Thermoanaerobaculia bacterium]